MSNFANSMNPGCDCCTPPPVTITVYGVGPCTAVDDLDPTNTRLSSLLENCTTCATISVTYNGSPVTVVGGDHFTTLGAGTYVITGVPNPSAPGITATIPAYYTMVLDGSNHVTSLTSPGHTYSTSSRINFSIVGTYDDPMFNCGCGTPCTCGTPFTIPLTLVGTLPSTVTTSGGGMASTLPIGLFQSANLVLTNVTGWTQHWGYVSDSVLTYTSGGSSYNYRYVLTCNSGVMTLTALTCGPTSSCGAGTIYSEGYGSQLIATWGNAGTCLCKTDSLLNYVPGADSYEYAQYSSVYMTLGSCGEGGGGGTTTTTGGGSMSIMQQNPGFPSRRPLPDVPPIVVNPDPGQQLRISTPGCGSCGGKNRPRLH